jgi:hypothetical protein
MHAGGEQPRCQWVYPHPGLLEVRQEEKVAAASGACDGLQHLVMMIMRP